MLETAYVRWIEGLIVDGTRIMRRGRLVELSGKEVGKDTPFAYYVKHLRA